MIPLPLVLKSAVCFEAQGLYGQSVVIRGVALEISPDGEASYVDEFPGRKPLDVT